MAKPANCFANFPVNKQPSTSEVIRRYRSTYEGCALVPLFTSSIGDSELIINFQEAYARLFPNCYNKLGIQSNLPSHRPINQGTICAKVYPEGIQPIKGNKCGLIPYDHKTKTMHIIQCKILPCLNHISELPSVLQNFCNTTGVNFSLIVFFIKIATISYLQMHFHVIK